MAVALSGLATHSLVAQAEKIPRVRLTVGVVFARLQTSVRYDIGNGLIGLRVGFEKQLGLAEFQTFPTVQASYRVGGRHHVVGGYYNLGRKGTNQISVDLPLPDTTLTIGTTVESDFDTRVFTLGYGYSLLQTPTTSITPLRGVVSGRLGGRYQ